MIDKQKVQTLLLCVFIALPCQAKVQGAKEFSNDFIFGVRLMAGEGCIPVQICSCHQKGSLLWAAFVTLMNPQRVILETLKLYFIESSLQAAESHQLAELHLADFKKMDRRVIFSVTKTQESD